MHPASPLCTLLTAHALLAKGEASPQFSGLGDTPPAAQRVCGDSGEGSWCSRSYLANPGKVALSIPGSSFACTGTEVLLLTPFPSVHSSMSQCFLIIQDAPIPEGTAVSPQEGRAGRAPPWRQSFRREVAQLPPLLPQLQRPCIPLVPVSLDCCVQS